MSRMRREAFPALYAASLIMMPMLCAPSPSATNRLGRLPCAQASCGSAAGSSLVSRPTQCAQVKQTLNLREEDVLQRLAVRFGGGGGSPSTSTDDLKAGAAPAAAAAGLS